MDKPLTFTTNQEVIVYCLAWTGGALALYFVCLFVYACFYFYSQSHDENAKDKARAMMLKAVKILLVSLVINLIAYYYK
jgi:hypothetical protein